MQSLSLPCNVCICSNHSPLDSDCPAMYGSCFSTGLALAVYNNFIDTQNIHHLLLCNITRMLYLYYCFIHFLPIMDSDEVKECGRAKEVVSSYKDHEICFVSSI